MIKKLAFVGIFLVLFGGLVVGSTISWAVAYFYMPGPLHKTTTVIIAANTPLQRIAEQLFEAHVIRHPLLFWVTTHVAKGKKILKAGEYAFTPAISPKQVMEMLADGRSVIHRLTIVEGDTTHQVITKVLQEPALMGDIPSGIEEGSLLPQTYFFSYGDQRQKLLERMQNAMQTLLMSLWATRYPNLPFTTPSEAVVLASIVEKETGAAEERGKVAAVFINRLRKNMRLQSDPTVIYALTSGRYELKRGLIYEDLKTASLYNTYVITGLPPKPIANPGKASLMAVLHPPETTDYYFVANGRGGHYFASSLKEHNRNVHLYRNATQH